MKKLNQLQQTIETQVSFPCFEALNKLEMQLVKGGDGDPQNDLPPPPPPPPTPIIK